MQQQFKAGDRLKNKRGKLQVDYIGGSEKGDHLFNGIVRAPDAAHPLGYYSNGWRIECFEVAEPVKQAPDKAQEVNRELLEEIVARLSRAIKEIDGISRGEIVDRMQWVIQSINLATGKDAASEVPELPGNGRWCIRRTPENSKMVNGYFNTIDSRLFTESWGYMHDPEVDDSRNLPEVHPGYTEITTAQFKKHVLKQ